MPRSDFPRVGYVLKRYPRFSETFIVSEILAHEAAGASIEIFSLRPPNDAHFQDEIARVRAPVTYLPYTGVRAAEFWQAIELAAVAAPGVSRALEAARGEDAIDVYQSMILAREVRLRGLDHLHAHFATSATTVARLASLAADVPFSFTAHAKDIFHESVRDDDLRRKLASAAAVVTVSDFNVEYLRARYGDDATRVRRIYNGLDLERFAFSDMPRPRRIVAVGRLVEKKGFADLVDACALLASHDDEFDCLIVGAGPLEPALRAQIEARGLQGRVALLGSRPQGDIVRLVGEAAVFAAPSVVGEDSNRDGLPTVLLEAMALGTPCVATDVTGIPEVVQHHDTGLLVPQHAPSALADALATLLDDAPLRHQLARRARALIEESFDATRTTQELRELFQPARATPIAGAA